MTAAAEKPAPKEPGNDLQKVADLLGGPRILSRRITSALDAHELLLDGLPGSALTHTSSVTSSSFKRTRWKKPSE